MESLVGDPSRDEERLDLIHRVIVPDERTPKEYAVLVTNRRSIFVRQNKTRNSWVLRQEMKFGTALVTDVTPKTLQDYSAISLETLSSDLENLTLPHDSIRTMTMRADHVDRRRRDFFVWMVMKRQEEIFQVYNFEINYQNNARGESRILFYAVPLGSYFKPRRQSQTRERILREYAQDVLMTYQRVLSRTVIHQLSAPRSEASI